MYLQNFMVYSILLTFMSDIYNDDMQLSTVHLTLILPQIEI